MLSGALGHLRELHIRAFIAAGAPTGAEPPPWRESFAMNAGGILTNWSCYDLDYVLGVAGWSFRPRMALAQFWPCASIPPLVAPGPTPTRTSPPSILR